MIRFLLATFACIFSFSTFSFSQQSATTAPFTPPDKIFGYRNPEAELEVEKTFLAVPDPQLAKEHLRVLTAAPHVAGSLEDRKTAEYVLSKYKAAGLDAYIQEYKVYGLAAGHQGRRGSSGKCRHAWAVARARQR